MLLMVRVFEKMGRPFLLRVIDYGDIYTKVKFLLTFVSKFFFVCDGKSFFCLNGYYSVASGNSLLSKSNLRIFYISVSSPFSLRGLD